MAKKKAKVTASSILNEANRQSAARDKVDARQILNRATAQAGEPVRDRAAERERERRKQETLAYLDQLKQEREQRLAPWRAGERVNQAKEDGLYTSPFSEASKARMAGAAKARTYAPGVANGALDGREEIRAILDRERYKAATAPIAQRSADDGHKAGRANPLESKANGTATEGWGGPQPRGSGSQEGYLRSADGHKAGRANPNAGWRRIGNRLALVTEGNPLPGKSFASPRDYVDTMRAVDEYNAWKAQAPAGRQRVGELDTESRAFLQRWMGSGAEDAIPTMDDVLRRYGELGENPARQELFWREWNENAALNEAVNRDEKEEREAHRREGEGKRAAYETALGRLPAGMAGMAKGNTADYYAYLSKAADGKGADASEKSHPFAGYAQSQALIKGRGADSRYDYLDYSMNVPKWADQRRARRWAVSTDEERKTYDTLKRVYGEEAAQGYEDSMREEWDRRVTQYETGAARRVADEMPVVSSVRDVFAAPVKGVDYIERLGRQALGQEVKAYDQATLLGRVTDASRGQVGRNIRNEHGNVWGFVYDNTLSLIDNLANQAVWGGLGTTAALASMGASVATSSYNDAIDRGADVNEAMAVGTMAGLAEMIFERVPLERFMDLVKGKSSGKFVMELLRQSGIEATEEMCTELANTITDSLIMGEKSNYAKSVEAYRSQGMDGDAARRAAMLDVCKSIGLSGLGGAFGGMAMGGVGQGIGALNRRSEARARTDQEGRESGGESVRTDGETAAKGMPDLMNAEGLEVEYTPLEGKGGEMATEAAEEAEVRSMPDLMNAAFATATEGWEGPQPRGSGSQESYLQSADGREAGRANPMQEGKPGETTLEATEEPTARDEKKAASAHTQASPAPLTRREGVAVSEESGEGEAVTVTGVRGVENGHVYFQVETADGEASVMSDMDIDLADAEGMELLATGTAGRMDARGAAAYLDGYDAGIATVQQYASAFAGVYTRAKTGLGYEMAADSEAARRYLTQDAAREAYMAGLAAYNEGLGISKTDADGMMMYSLKETRGMSWEEQTRKVKDKTVSRNATLNLGTSGRIYTQFDMDDLDIGMNIGDLRKITRDAKGSRSAHALNESVIRALPNEIAHPVAVFDNPERNCVYVLTNQRDGEGNPVVAVIAKNSNDGIGTRMHQVKSAYGMQDVMGYMNDHLKENAKRKIYNKKAFNTILAGAHFTNNGADIQTYPAVAHYTMNGVEYQKGVERHDYTISQSPQNSNTPKQITDIKEKGILRLYDVTKIKEASKRVWRLSEINQNAPSAEASANSISKTETTSKKKPGVTRKYSANAFAKLSGEQKRASIAQIELLDVLAKRTGRMIDVVDTIDGGRANAKYDPKTGRITIALDATEGAYLYAGMHELTHAIKAEHTGEWQDFAEYVTQTLERNGQDIEKLIAYQMERFGYDREQALEEVICNTAPAVLRDESNLKSLLRTDRGLYERVLDWISGLLKDIRRAGERLSQRGKSWEQMDALSGDREALRGIYERMMGILEGEESGELQEKTEANNAERLSVSETFEAEYDAWAKNKERNKTINVGTTSKVLAKLGAKEQNVIMRSDDVLHALRHEGMTDEIMKQIPQMMENPIVVMKSSQLGNKNQHEASRVVMYGNVTDKNGAPVIAVLELRERMEGGRILDMQLVKNAYGKDNRLDVQVQKSEILYLDPNKKRTNSWLHSLRLQLPSDTTNYGSMGSISYPNGYVKMQGIRYENLLAENGRDGAYSQKEAQAAYAGKNLAEDGSVYAYEFLTKLPDMRVTKMAEVNEVQRGSTIAVENIISLAKENGNQFGEVNENQIVINNRYTGRKIRLTTSAIRHGLSRSKHAAQLANARAAARAGELLANAVPVNALYDKSKAAHGTYAMAAYMENADASNKQIAVLTVEQRSGEVIGLEVYDTLHAINTRKWNAVVPKNQTASTAKEQNLTSPTRSTEWNAGDLRIQRVNSIKRSTTISIADLLAIVNETHQSLLSEDVLAHFNEERNPKGYYNGRAKFSLRDTDENVQTGLEALREASRLARGHGITALEAEKLARHMKKLTNSDMDTTELAREISRSYAYMERGEGVDMRQVDEEQVDLMARALEKSKVKDMEHERRAKPVRDYLRKTAIRLSESQRAEAESMTGSYNAYHRALFGSVRLNQKNGAALDSVWGELNALDAEWFPAEASEGDMARLLMEAADAAKPVYNTGLGMNAEEAAQYFAGEMNKAYMKLPGVRESARDIKAFDGSVKAYQDAQKRFKETSLAEYERALASIKEAREDSQRTQQQLREAALSKKYQEWRAKDTRERRERELVNRYRARIERTAGTMLKWYENPTDTKHIPEDLRQQVDGIITALDFTKKSTKAAASLSERIAALAGALDRASSEDGAAEGFAIERDQMWLDELTRLARLIPQHKAVYELNGAELKELSKWMDSVKHVLVEANKMHGTNLGSVEETAAASMAEMSKKKAYWQKSQAGRYMNDTIGIEMLDSFSYFKRLGPTAQRVFEGVRKGFDKNVENVRQARAYCEKLLEGVDVKALAGKRAKKTAYELESGETLELTRAQAMELYCLNGREQARGHLYGGGIRLYEDANVRPHKLTRADVENIVKTLTDEEKRIADGLQGFMARECAAWGNEVSMKLFAYKKFGEKSYYPIRVDSNETNTTRLDPASDMASIAAIRNQGMTKGLTEGANNAIMLGSVFDTFTRHVSQMNAYNAYAVPLYDMQRWLNTKGVKTEIEQLYGSAGKEYVLGFMKAVNGTVERSNSRITKPLTWLTRNAKTAAVGANLQVAIQQPTSYARAVNMIGGKYLAKAIRMQARPELVDRYCAIAQWKKWGFYETDIGPNLRGMLINEQGLAESLKDKSMWLSAKGDEWTLNHLWIACELETRDLHPELEEGTEEYYRHVGERMSGIVDRTQVVDSVFHRSQAMRHKDSYTQLATSFMAEPMKNYNMVMEAAAEYAEARRNGKNSATAKLAGRKLGRALYAYGLSNTLQAIVISLTAAARNSDDKEYWEKYLEALGRKAADSLNPFASIPVVGDTLDMVMRGGQAGSSLDNQSIQKIVWAAQEIGKYMSGKSELNWYGVGYKIAQAVSSVTGIPAGNLLRDVNALWQTATGKSLTLSETGSKRIAKDNLFKAMAEGDREAQARIRKKMREQLGMSNKEIDAAIGERLAEDERIAAGWKARKEMRVGDVNRLKNELAREGYTGEMVDKAIQRYGDMHKEKEEKEKNPDEQLKVKLYTTGDGADAVRGLADGSVSLEDARLMISEMAAESEAKEPEKSVRSGIQSEIKKDYLEAMGRGDTERMERLEKALASLFDAEESGEKKDGVGTTIKNWRKEVWNAELETAVDGGNQDGARRAVAKMRNDGWTDESVAATLRSRYKELYAAGGAATRDRISRMLCGLGLRTEKGNEYFTPEKIGEWGKK